MRIAIISITNEGALLAQGLTASLKGEIDVFAKVGRNPAEAKEYEHLGQLVATLFHQYDSFVFIMSVGVVVRVIAPHVRDKRYDPAVVVMDEAGSYAISLLSGHLGHVNALTRKVGESVNAQSVITTATDVLQKPAVDLLAVKINAAIEPFENLHTMNAAIDKGDSVSFFIDSTLANYETYIAAAEEFDVKLIDIKELADAASYDAAVVITDKELYMVKPYVFLRPASLVVGINCRPGATGSEILGAIADACRKAGRSTKSIAAIASSVVKEDEIGVLATAQQIEVPVRFFNAEELNQCIEKFGLKKSAIIDEKSGTSIANICEAAALVAAKTDSLILEATLYNNVMIAIAEAKSPWWE
jgi:cobalt-precorrin 5A hydrolase